MREIKFRVWRSDLTNIMYHDNEDGVVVMQYTGLKAKNGKEIYEGDIVKAIARYVTSDILLLAKCKTKEIVGVVEWDEGGWWCLKTQDEYLPKVGFYAVEEFVDVLGNVYENPGSSIKSKQ